MALIKSVRGFTPQIGENTYLSENATIVGDVTIGRDCSIWFNAVLRGDVNPIRIGDRVNIQDGSVLHTLYERSVVEIGNEQTHNTQNQDDAPILVDVAETDGGDTRHHHQIEEEVAGTGEQEIVGILLLVLGC